MFLFGAGATHLVADKNLSFFCLFGENIKTVLQKSHVFYIVSATGLILPLNQYESFLIATLRGDIWLIYCTRECSSHHAVVKLFSAVCFCSSMTGLAAQTALENVMFPLCLTLVTSVLVLQS